MRVFLPRSVHVRIAAGCNLGCIHCERENLPMAGPTGRRKRDTLTFADGRADLNLEKDMSLEIWDLVKTKLFDHTDTIELGGLGEPTLGKIFPTAAADVLAAGKQLFFFTNGHFLNLPRVLEAVGDTPHISISIDAGTPETYKSFRKGELSALIESVKGFRAAKPNAKLDSQFTATTDNIDDLPAFVELCAELGIGRFHAGEQILVVGADHHATSRVDKSIRFAKDRTLEAVNKARAIAEANGLYLLAQLPRFSELNANAAVDGSDPRALRRWADLMFYGDNPCGGTDGSDGSCLVKGSLILTRGGRYVPAELLEAGQEISTLTDRGEHRIEKVKAVAIGKEETLRIRHERGGFECSLSHPLPVPGADPVLAADLKVGDFLIGEGGTPTKILSIDAAGEQEVVVLELEGPCRLYFSGGAWHHNKTLTLITGDTVVTPPGGDLPGGPMFAAAPEEDEIEYVPTNKELYVDYDGKVWSCLARHEIGDLKSGTWETIVEKNPDYQSFLANWFFGTSNANKECKSCPRRK